MKRRYWLRAIAICILFGAPLGVLGKRILGRVNQDIDSAVKEHLGSNTIGPLNALLYHAVEYRLARFRLSGADAATSAAISSHAAEIDGAFATLEELGHKKGLKQPLSVELESGTMLQDAKRAWESLKARSEHLDAPKAERLIQVTEDLIARVADRSNLVLDSDFDSYSLMNIAITRYPLAMRQLGDLIYQSERIAKRKALSSREALGIALLIHDGRQVVDQMRHDYDRAIQKNERTSTKARLESVAQGALSDFEQSATELLDLTQEQIAAAAVLEIDRRELANAGKAALQSLYELGQDVQGELNSQLGARVRKDRVEKQRAFGLAGILFLAAAVGSYILLRWKAARPKASPENYVLHTPSVGSFPQV